MATENRSVLPNASEKSPSKRLRSLNSRKHSFPRFRNNTDKRVKVIWVDYDGNYVVKGTMSPGQFLDVNTFENHFWVFEDEATGDRMALSGQEVFHPVAYNHREESYPPKRKEYFVGIPVYRLEERCLQILRDSLTLDQLSSLTELPPPLRREIQRLIDQCQERSSR